MQAQGRAPLVDSQFFVEEAVAPGPDEAGLELEFHCWLIVQHPGDHKASPSSSPRRDLPAHGSCIRGARFGHCTNVSLMDRRVSGSGDRESNLDCQNAPSDEVPARLLGS